MMRHTVQNINLQTRKENTTKAYDPKAQEYYSFCNYRYSSVFEGTRYTVTTDKVLEFLFYQAMRPKYNRGGKKRRDNHGFDKDDYEAVVTSYHSHFKSV